MRLRKMLLENHHRILFSSSLLLPECPLFRCSGGLRVLLAERGGLDSHWRAHEDQERCEERVICCDISRHWSAQ